MACPGGMPSIPRFMKGTEISDSYQMSLFVQSSHEGDLCVPPTSFLSPELPNSLQYSLALFWLYPLHRYLIDVASEHEMVTMAINRQVIV